jgi:hypothetical protein
MARGQNASTGRTARSEAGTIFRGDTANARMARVSALLAQANLPVSEQSDEARSKNPFTEAQAILAGNRPTKDAYEIRLAGYDALKPSGKLNLLEGTIDGKKIDTAQQDKGAFDRSGTKSRNSEDAAAGFETGKSQANREQGFVFAADDDDKVYAIPHTWDTNNPQGTVGIFRGDRITNVGEKGKVMNLRVIGTFDSSPRGLQLAAAASGDFIGRTNGIKQTATVLAESYGGKYTAASVVAGMKVGTSVLQRAGNDIKRGKLGDKSDGYGGLQKLDERLT